MSSKRRQDSSSDLSSDSDRPEKKSKVKSDSKGESKEDRKKRKGTSTPCCLFFLSANLRSAWLLLHFYDTCRGKTKEEGREEGEKGPTQRSQKTIGQYVWE